MPVIPVVIPAYEPDGRLLILLDQLSERKITPVIVVDDGSGENYTELFRKAGKLAEAGGGCLLRHERNCGKGRALKTAFQYVLTSFPDAAGVVTADSDGQHRPECIEDVRRALCQNPDSLVLGARTFDDPGIPWKSRFGNRLTVKLMQYFTGIRVSDTQTGLRGIPRAFLEKLLNVRGERFEFETEMLLASRGEYPIVEVPIRTVYDSKSHHQTHFRPLADSWRIYKILGRSFLGFVLSSLSSSILDLCLFTLLCHLLRGRARAYILIATIAARILSAAYNYGMNYKKVFRSRSGIRASAVRYALLAAAQMLCSGLLVTAAVRLLGNLPEVVIKAMVDTALFFVSYKIQQKFVF